MRAFTFSDPGWMGRVGASSAAGFTSFSFVGSLSGQTWVVPTGVTQVTVRAWGSAGTGFDPGPVGGVRGGYGGYVTGTFPVVTNQTALIKVGWGGGSGKAPGGGYVSVEYPSVTPTVWLLAAGGGGSKTGAQGGDAGATGFSGQSFNAGYLGGGGATPLAGGLMGFPSGIGTTGNGSLLQGGHSVVPFLGSLTTAGAGGGGGYFGGGAGGYSGNGAIGAGGGGGANLVSGIAAGLSTNTSGTVGFSDPNWSGSAGSGAFGYVYISFV